MARLGVVRSGVVLALMLNMTGAFAPTHLSSRFMLLDPPRLTRRCNGRGLRMSVFDEPALMLAATAAATSKAFEAQPPPLGTTLAVLGSTGGVLAYWWLVLVPSERRDLAKNKNKGGLNEYLDQLENTPASERKLEKWFYTEWLERRARVKRIAAANAAKRVAAASAASAIGDAGNLAANAVAERTVSGTETLESELEAAEAEVELQELEAAREREIENAVPLPSFFSLDNPIIIALALALFGAAFGGLGR